MALIILQPYTLFGMGKINFELWWCVIKTMKLPTHNNFQDSKLVMVPLDVSSPKTSACADDIDTQSEKLVRECAERKSSLLFGEYKLKVWLSFRCLVVNHWLEIICRLNEADCDNITPNHICCLFIYPTEQTIRDLVEENERIKVEVGRFELGFTIYLWVQKPF